MNSFLFLFFVSIASGIHITCGFHDYKWRLIGEVYTCTVTSADFSDNSTHITGVGGIHKRGKSSVDVQMINFGWPAGCPDNLLKIPK
jgi:hypothetical protein